MTRMPMTRMPMTRMPMTTMTRTRMTMPTWRGQSNGGVRHRDVQGGGWV